jgi:hypothetical protein
MAHHGRTFYRCGEHIKLQCRCPVGNDGHYDTNSGEVCPVINCAFEVLRNVPPVTAGSEGRPDAVDSERTVR